MLRPFYREFDLAWTFPEEDAERFRKILLSVLLVFLLLGVLIPLLPTPQREESTAEDVPPRLESLFVENGDGAGPFGAKGVGEGSLIPVSPAVANALARLTGVRLHELPLTPERVWRALRARQRDGTP